MERLKENKGVFSYPSSGMVMVKVREGIVVNGVSSDDEGYAWVDVKTAAWLLKNKYAIIEAEGEQENERTV